mmetsp:Transcript_34938/g.112186  ORF Transcript_34938/g.112186 Transcript_34938/m.112186 type:complete len:261 (+) Transcript_34938:419-1201(+)
MERCTAERSFQMCIAPKTAELSAAASGAGSRAFETSPWSSSARKSTSSPIELPAASWRMGSRMAPRVAGRRSAAHSESRGGSSPEALPPPATASAASDAAASTQTATPSRQVTAASFWPKSDGQPASCRRPCVAACSSPSNVAVAAATVTVEVRGSRRARLGSLPSGAKRQRTTPSSEPAAVCMLSCDSSRPPSAAAKTALSSARMASSGRSERKVAPECSFSSARTRSAWRTCALRRSSSRARASCSRSRSTSSLSHGA